MPSSAIRSYPKSFYPYIKGKKVWRSSALTEEVRSYQEGSGDRRAVLDKLYYFVYSYPVDKGLLREEEASEFLLYFIPTVDYILGKFSFQGYPVEQYLIRCIRFRLKNFRRERTKRTYEQMTIAQATSESVYHEPEYERICCEPHPLYISGSSNARTTYLRFTLEDSGEHRIAADKLLYLALQYALLLPAALISRLDKLFSSQLDRKLPVSDLIMEVRLAHQRKLERFTHLQRQRNALYARIIRIETDMTFTEEGERLVELQAQLRRRRNEYERVVEKLRQFNMLIPHRQIAQTLGIPKGSVDSGLFYLKKRQKSLLDAL